MQPDPRDQIIAELRAEIASLKAEIVKLKEENASLKAENARLKGSGPDPSTPSGMIPSYLKGNNHRGRSRKPGRKFGHQGVRRSAPKKPDRTRHHVLCQCPDCGTKLSKPCRQRRRLVEDLLPSTGEVVEEVVHGSWCPSCQKIVEPVVTDALPHATLGLHLVVVTAWMRYGLGMTTGKVVRWLSTMCQVVVSAGGLVHAWYLLRDRLRAHYETIGEDARNSAVLHADETGWRVGGKSFWLWCFTAKDLAYYVIDRCRGSPVVLRVLGEIFEGVLCVDFFGAYNRIVAMAKQRCIAHLFRELKKVSEYNRSQEWRSFAKKVKRLFRDAIRFQELGGAQYKRSNESRFLRFYPRLDQISEASYRDSDCRRLTKRLRRHREELFTFLALPDVDASNNHAERQIRPAVVCRKNSYCNRSDRGAETQAILMSVFRTAELRGQDPIANTKAIIREQLTKHCHPTYNSISIAA